MDWEAVGAIGSMLAVAVALGLAGRDIFERRGHNRVVRHALCVEMKTETQFWVFRLAKAMKDELTAEDSGALRALCMQLGDDIVYLPHSAMHTVYAHLGVFKPAEVRMLAKMKAARDAAEQSLLEYAKKAPKDEEVPRRLQVIRHNLRVLQKASIDVFNFTFAEARAPGEDMRAPSDGPAPPP